MIKFFRSGIFTAFISLVLSMPFAAQAGEPTEQLRATLNDFVVILTNTPVAELQAHGLPQKALKLVFARFDFAEMTKLSLGSHWKALAQTEQNEFIEAFTQRLLMLYGKTVYSNSGEKVQFQGEVQKGPQTTVETKVVSDNGDVLPIDYRLHDIDGQWKVYDVVIDHVSMVNNYRAQFDHVIAKSSVKNLLQTIKVQQPGS